MAIIQYRLPTIDATPVEDQHPLAVMYPKLSGGIYKALDAGYLEEDIRKSIGRRVSKAVAAGYNTQEINERLSAVPKKVEVGKRYTEALREGALSSVIGLAETGEISKFHPTNTLERVAFGGMKLIMDLPIYTLGGELGGAPGAFALPAGLEETLKQNIKGERGFWSKWWKVGEETAKGAALGYAMGVASKIKGPLKAFLAEYGVLAAGGPSLEGRVPTLTDAIDTAIFLGSFKGFNKGVKFIGDVTNRKLSTINDDILREAKRKGITPEKELADRIKETIGEEFKSLIEEDGKVNADRVDTAEERSARIEEAKQLEESRLKRLSDEEIESVQAERARIEEAGPFTTEEVINPSTGEITSRPTVEGEIVRSLEAINEIRDTIGVVREETSKIDKAEPEELDDIAENTHQDLVRSLPEETRRIVEESEPIDLVDEVPTKEERIATREAILARRREKEIDTLIKEGEVIIEKDPDQILIEAAEEIPRLSGERVTDAERKLAAAIRENPTRINTEAESDILREAGGLVALMKKVDREAPDVQQVGVSSNRDAAKSIEESIVEADLYDDTLYFHSGIPVDRIIVNAIKAVNPFVKSIMNKIMLGNKDVNIFIRNKFRVPFWSPVARSTSIMLHKLLDRQPMEYVFVAEEYKRNFDRLPRESQERISEHIYKEDAIGKKLPVDHLSPEEVGGYRSSRAIFDYYHNVMLRKLVQGFLDRNISDSTIAEKGGVSPEEFKALSKEKKASIKKKVVSSETSNFLKKHFIDAFAPRYRFGRFVAHVTRKKDGKTIHNEGVDTEVEAQRILDTFSNKGEGSRIIDTKHEFNEYKDMMAIANYLPGIEKMLKDVGIKDREISKAIELITQNYAMGRLAKRKGVEGYSRDLSRSMETYIQHFPRSMAKRFNADIFSKIISNLPHKVREYNKDLVDFYYGRKWKEGELNTAARTAMYGYYLFLKPAFGVLNFSQRATMTAPWTVDQIVAQSKTDGRPVNWAEATAEGWKRVGNAQVKELKLMKDIFLDFIGHRGERLGGIIDKANYLSEAERGVLKKLYQQGELRELRQLEAAQGHKILKWLDLFGFISERSNRIHAALVGAKLYEDYGLKGKAITEATDNFLHSTQIMYSKANRMEAARGPLAPVMMFKSFLANYLNMGAKLYGRENKAAFANMAATLLAIGGVASVPFFTDEVKGMVDLFMNRYYGDKWELDKRMVAEKINDSKAAKVAMYGIPSLVGIDASSMVGPMGVINTPILPIVRGSFNTIKNLNRQDMTFLDKIKPIMPLAPRKWYSFYKLSKYGTLTDRFGKPYLTKIDIRRLPPELKAAGMEIYEKLPKDWSFTTKIEVLFGFPSVQVNQYYKDIWALRDTTQKVRNRKTILHRAYAQAVYNEDEGEVERIAKEFEERGYTFNPQSVISHLIEYNELPKGEENK